MGLGPGPVDDTEDATPATRERSSAWLIALVVVAALILVGFISAGLDDAVGSGFLGIVALVVAAVLVIGATMLLGRRSVASPEGDVPVSPPMRREREHHAARPGFREDERRGRR